MASNIPADVGMPPDEVLTPSLVVDLDAFDGNLARMAAYVRERGITLRAHAKTHKTPAIALQQIAHGAVGVCCQKVSEAEAMVDGGVGDVLVSNQVVQPRMIDRLAALASRARLSVCVDDAANVEQLSRAAQRAGSRLDVLVEMDVGAGRCGVPPGEAVVALAQHIARSPGLRFLGLQAYNGRAQHYRQHAERRAAVDRVIEDVRRVLALLASQGLRCRCITGAGTGTYRLEGASDVFTELQCGSYIFMDADYGRLLGADGAPVRDFEQSLFILTTVMSKCRAGSAVCDAGLKAHSIDSGLPRVHGRQAVDYTAANDEHGVLQDPLDELRVGDKLYLIPGHCDPTVNLHDWLVGVRGGRVECVWPVSARGMLL